MDSKCVRIKGGSEGKCPYFNPSVCNGEDTCALEAMFQSASNQLEIREDHINKILFSLPDLVFVLDKNGIFKTYYGSESALYIKPEFFLNRAVAEVMPGGVASLTLRAMEVVSNTGEPQVYEYSLSVGDCLRTYESRVAATASGDFLCVIRDVTDKAELRFKFHRLFDLLEMASNKSSMAMIVTDEKFKILLVNNHAISKLREPRDNLIGVDALELFGVTDCGIIEPTVDYYSGVVSYKDKLYHLKIKALVNGQVHGYGFYFGCYQLAKNLARLEKLRVINGLREE